MDFTDLFIRHGAASYDKQIYLRAMYGKTGWGFDLNTGVLAFRRPHEAPLQLAVEVLGTESEDTNSWLWSWANHGVPPTLTVSALQLKQLGETQGILEFSNAEQDIAPKVNPQRIGLVAVGVLRASCFFRAPYPRGAMYLLIKDPKYKRSVTRPVRRVVRAFPMFLSRHFVADQRAAFMNYLQFYRLSVTEAGNRVIAAGVTPRSIHGEGTPEQLVAEFDDANRLISLQMAS
jgi:hypothetical protein